MYALLQQRRLVEDCSQYLTSRLALKNAAGSIQRAALHSFHINGCFPLSLMKYIYLGFTLGIKSTTTHSIQQLCHLNCSLLQF